MIKNLLFLLAVICFCKSSVTAQTPGLPTKGTLSETLLSSKTFTIATQADTVVKQRSIPDAYTLEVVGKVNSATGRGLDIEARNSVFKGFRLSLDASNLKWTSSLSSIKALSTARGGDDQIIRIAVKNDSAHIYQNGAYIQTYPLATIKDIVGGAESSQLVNSTNMPNLLPNWSGIAPNNTGKPSDYGWLLNPTSTTLFAAANSTTAGTSRYMDVSASSGSNLHTYNGSTYTGRLLFVRWDGSAIQNMVYAYPVTLEANTTYDFSMLHAYISNATGSKTITVGIGKTTAASGRIASQVFTTSGTRDLKRGDFVFTSQEAGTYYITVTGNWGLFSIGELSLSRYAGDPRFIFGKNYPSGSVNMEISSVTYEDGAYAPGGIVTGPQQNITVTDKVASYLPIFNTNFIVPGKTDLHLTGDYAPLINSTVALNSADAWLFFDNIKPSVVISNWLSKVSINGVSAVGNPNVRIAIYKNGTVVIPNGNQTLLHALEVFSGTNLSGDTASYQVDTYHNNLGVFDNNIRSFKLRRGYMATLANNADGSGYSRVFVANDSDLIVHTMPQGLDGTVSFIRVFKWNWVSKKGKAGWSPAQVGATWYYDWNVGGSSATDYDYAVIRQNGGWPSWDAINTKPNVNHLLGFNEPDRPDQSNLTVDQAIAQWPEMMKSGYRIGSPAPSDPYNGWLPPFLKKADSLNYRVDYVAIHCYWGGMSPQQWYDRLLYVYNNIAGKRPLWITEWNNGANWTSESWPSDTTQALQKQLNDLKGILQVLDTASFVERYAEYDWVQYKRALVLADTLTPAGKYYYANNSDFAYNPKVAFVHTWKLASPKLSSSISNDDYYKVTLSFKDLNGELGSKYILERKIDARDADFVAVQTYTGYVNGSDLSFVDSVYAKAIYRVKAYNLGADQFVYSGNLEVLQDAAPIAPTSLTGIVLSAAQDSIKWNAGTNVRSYNLKRSLSASGPFETILARTTLLQYQDTALSPSTTYYYVVTSLNSAGESANSTVLQLTTKDLVAPVAVLNPHAASGDNKVTLTWDFQYDAKYQISRAQSANGTYSVIASDVNAVRYEDNSVTNGTTYYYKVVAFNAAGSSSATQMLQGRPVDGRHLYVSFNESAGVFAEDTWGGYHGTLGATLSHVTGHNNGGVQMDGGASSYLSLAPGAVAGLNDFTIATWVRMDALSNWMRIFDFGTGTSSYMFLTSQASVSNGVSTIRYGIKNGGVEQLVNYGYSWPLNTWTHLAISRFADTVRLYVNGTLVASNNAVTIKPSDLGNTTQNYIGKSQYNDPLLKASIDEFKIYNYALSKDELAEAMKEEQLITWIPITEQQAGNPDFAAGATASSGLPVMYTSSNEKVAVVENGVIHIVGAGISAITAQQSGDDVYAAAKPVTHTIKVNKLYYVDGDGDGFGTNETMLFATEITPAGYAVNNWDCDDTKVMYADLDRDGLGSGQPVACGVANNRDCDDTNPVQLTAIIPDVYAVNPDVDAKNTLYIGYGPTALTITAQPTGGTAPYTYVWKKGEGSQALSASEVISVREAGTYTVTITDAKGCTTTAFIIINTLDVRCGNNNEKVMICHNGMKICVASAAVQEHLNHGDNLGGCPVASAISLNTGRTAEESYIDPVVLYPNPVTDLLNIRISHLETGAMIQVYNASGVLVVSQRLTNIVQSISLKGLTAGVYYAKIQNGVKIKIGKVIKQ